MAGQEVRAALAAWESLFRAQSTLLRQFEREDVWGRLSLREYDVLFALTGFADRTARIRDLAAATLVTQPSLSRLVDRMAAAGLVAKVAVVGDRRGVGVRLTDAGLAVQREVGLAHARSIARHLGSVLDAGELATLARLCDRLAAGAAEP